MAIFKIFEGEGGELSDLGGSFDPLPPPPLPVDRRYNPGILYREGEEKKKYVYNNYYDIVVKRQV